MTIYSFLMQTFTLLTDAYSSLVHTSYQLHAATLPIKLLGQENKSSAALSLPKPYITLLIWCQVSVLMCEFTCSNFVCHVNTCQLICY